MECCPQLISHKKATDINEGALKEVPKKVTIAAQDTAIPDRGITPNSLAMTLISSDDDIIISPKRTPQHCPVTLSSPKKSSSEKDTEATQSSSKPPGRSRPQTKFFGSPIRHVVKEISASAVSPEGKFAVPYLCRRRSCRRLHKKKCRFNLLEETKTF